MHDTIKLSDGRVIPRQMVEDYKHVRRMDADTRPTKIWLDERAGMVHDRAICPNCQGPQGDGYFHVPTGEKTRPYLCGLTVDEAYEDHKGEIKNRTVSVKLDRQMKEYPCPVCNTGRMAQLIQHSGLAKAQFDDLDTSIWGMPGRGPMEKVALDTRDRWLHGDLTGWLTLAAPYGSGKTHIAQVIVKEGVLRGIKARYVMLTELSQAVMNTIGTNQTPEEALRRWRHADLIAVDEADWFGLRSSSGNLKFATEHIFHLLERRHQERAATLFITPVDWWQKAGEQWRPAASALERLNMSDWLPFLSRMTQGELGIAPDASDLRQAVGELERDNK